MVIGLCGYRGSGKTVVARYLREMHGFKPVNFKDSLVKEITEKFPNLLATISTVMDSTKYDGNKPWNNDRLFKEKPPLMRALMQEYGTDVRRADNPNYWVDKWKQSAGTGENIVADDVRFGNELLAVEEKGGVMIRVKRPDITTGGEHQSETEQESFSVDFTIEANPGDIIGIEKQIESILAVINRD